MVYNFNKTAYLVLKEFKLGDLIPTVALHNRITEITGFTKMITRANFLKTLERLEFIKMKEIGVWELIKYPIDREELNKYEV